MKQYQTDKFESEVGITSFLSQGLAFEALVKLKFTDFIVNEIDQNGNVVWLKDKKQWKDFAAVKESHKEYMEQQQSQPKDRSNPFDDFELPSEFHDESVNAVGEDVTLRLEEFVIDLKQNPHHNKFEQKVHLPAEREKRILIHGLIKKYFPFMETITKNSSNQKKQTKDDKAKQKSDQIISRQGEVGSVDENQDHILIKIHNANLKKFKSKTLVKPETTQQKLKYVRFTMMKRNIDTINAGLLISKFLGLSNKHFGIAGTKDKRGITTQRASLQGIAMDQLVDLQLRKNWNQNIAIGDYEYSNDDFRLGHLYGNRFAITMRLLQDLSISDKWELAKNIESLKAKGFINYFGLQRFGHNSDIKTHHIGKAIIQKNWKDAFGMILLSSGTQEDDIKTAIIEYLKDYESDRVLKILPLKFRIEKMLVQNLKTFGKTNFLQAILSLPKNLREIYPHAYQSFLWNKTATKRIQEYGDDICIGDLVLTDPNVQVDLVDDEIAELQEIEEGIDLNEQQDERKEQIEFTLITEQNIKHYNFSQVVLPIYGIKVPIHKSSLAYTLYNKVFEEEGIVKEEFEHASQKFFIEGGVRNLICVPENVEHEIIHYADKEQDIMSPFYLDEPCKQNEEGKYLAVIIKTTLKKSSYATMMIRELMKIPSSQDYQQILNEKFKQL